MVKVIGYDPGFGNTKICLDNGDGAGYQTKVMQSAVSRPVEIGKAAIGMKTSTTSIRIQVDGQDYYVGENAWMTGKILSNLDYMSLVSTERKALFYATLSTLLPPEEHQVDLMVIGLPVPLLQDVEQANQVLNALKTYKGKQSFRVNGKDYSLDIKKIKYLAQPVGTYMGWLLNDQNHITRGKGTCEAAILDVGMNTLDLYSVKGDTVNSSLIGGGKVGVRRLLELVQKPGYSTEELDSEIRSGRLKVPQSALDSWLGQIMAIIESVWPTPSRFSAVIPTGGGAALLNTLLNDALTSKRAFVHWPEDPILANAVGLWKWGNHVFD